MLDTNMGMATNDRGGDLKHHTDTEASSKDYIYTLSLARKKIEHALFLTIHPFRTCPVARKTRLYTPG